MFLPQNAPGAQVALVGLADAGIFHVSHNEEFLVYQLVDKLEYQ